MRNEADDPELRSLLARFDVMGGVLDYVFIELPEAGPPHARHRVAALAGMAEINLRIKQCGIAFRLCWDEAKQTGKPVSFSNFWGTDDVEPKQIGASAWSVPMVDGYKPAFFHPPYGLGGSANEKRELFAAINRYALGADPDRAEIFSWSTDWSNYFEAGHEWWGAFYWTVRPAGSQRMVVIGASSTD